MLKFKSLTVKRTESYQTPANTLVAVAEFIDEDNGAISTILDQATVIQLMEVMKGCAAARAKQLAKHTSSALDDAAAELTLATDSFTAITEKE